jgi:tetratricopeptide (TPR) repeat protein
MQAFISHSSEDSRFAGQVANALASSQIDVWLDRSNIRLGVLLRNELQSAIKKSRVMVLLWSKAAASSRWVSSEILTAFHLKRFIVTCVLDKTRLPLFLAKSVYLTHSGKKNLKALAEAVLKAPRGPNPFPSPMIARSADLNNAINTLAAGQGHEVAALGKRDMDSARKTHALVNNAMLEAEKKWRLDPMILNLAGFHRKNAYMLKHWDAVQAYQPRRDPLLHRAERLFFRSLFIDPTDHNALDGIASVLMLEGENDAAVFFDERAIEIAASKGIDYKEAKENIQLIKRFQQAGARTPPARRMQSPRSLLDEGYTQFGAGNYAAAVAAFEAVLKAEPESAEAHLRRGSSLLYLNRGEEGLEAIEKALAIEPGRLEARSARGAALIGFGRYEEGLKDIEAVLAAHPGDPQATYNKACAYSVLGKTEEAIALLAQCIKRDGQYRMIASRDPYFGKLRDDPKTDLAFRTIVS